MSDVDFQSLASKQGEQFHQAVEFLLLASGWTINARKIKIAGAEIDIDATDPDGRAWWIECKGSYRGKTPGSKRGDTAKKAVGVAAYLSTLAERRPYMLITSHYPARDTIAWRMLETARQQGWFAEIKVTGFGGEVDDLSEEEQEEGWTG